VVSESTFRRTTGEPRGFLRLRARNVGCGAVIEDENLVSCMLVEGLFCGLQNSVIRSRVFDHRRFATEYDNEAEDVLFAIRVMLAGHKFGYVNCGHVIYHVHEANSSAAGVGPSVDKQLRVYKGLLQGFEQLREDRRLSRCQQRVLDYSLSHIYFWTVG